MDEFDYVIVGAGSAGCVLAARLSESGDNRVALLEAGGKDNYILITMPAGVGEIRRAKRFDWDYLTEPVPNLRDRRISWPRGKVLGGSSSINGMIYVRGNRSDYDGWASLQLRGWSYAECLPYFKRLESNPIESTSYHSKTGPVGVSNASSGLPVYDALVEAGVQAGYPRTSDFNGEQQEGVGLFQYSVKDGERCSTARAYLRPAAGRRNLETLVEAQATRVLFEGKRAVGVEYVQRGERKQLRALKEVIVSGGTVNSPQLLKLSGIGPGEELSRFGIDVVADLPGVGENLQDHVDYHVQYECLTSDTYDKYLTSRLRMAWVGLRYLLSRTGPGSTMPVDMGGFLKTRPELESPDIELQALAAFPSNLQHRAVTRGGPRNGFNIHITKMRPASRGRIELKSADPFEHPAIFPNYLGEEADLITMREGIRVVRNIVSQPAMTPFRGRELRPGAHAASDAELDERIAEHCDCDYHPVGTCKMGTDAEAVVDETCRVSNVEALRVVDASIMPVITTGNTNVPTIMIAEKMSDAILGKPFLPPEAV